MVVECQRLLAVTSIFGVIQVDNEVLGRAGKAGNELQGEGLADAVDILAPRRVFEARNRRPRCQRCVIVERRAGCAKLEHRVVTQAVRVVSVLVAAADLVDPLRQNIVIQVVHITLMAAARQGCGNALDQADLEVDTAQQNWTEFGRQAAAGAIGTNAMGGNGCKTELL